MTAEKLYEELKKMSPTERERFFGILVRNAFREEDLSAGQATNFFAGNELTAQKAAAFLELSMSTFRRHVASGKLHPNSTVGRNQMFSIVKLRAFKKALKATKG